jgi:predicted  nucleic acid-binding Zn-ribbon protein
MSLFRWVEDKLEQLDPISAARDTPPPSDLEKVVKEAQALQEQVLQLKSDMRTSRNYAEQQLAVSVNQAKDAACAEEVARLGKLLEEAETRVAVAMNENETIKQELSNLKATSELTLSRLERLQAIFESAENALNEENEGETVRKLRVLLE